MGKTAPQYPTVRKSTHLAVKADLDDSNRALRVTKRELREESNRIRYDEEGVGIVADLGAAGAQGYFGEDKADPILFVLGGMSTMYGAYTGNRYAFKAGIEAIKRPAGDALKRSVADWRARGGSIFDRSASTNSDSDVAPGPVEVEPISAAQ